MEHETVLPTPDVAAQVRATASRVPLWRVPDTVTLAENDTVLTSVYQVRSKPGRRDARLLHRFCALAGAKPANIARFVRTHGALAVGPDGRPRPAVPMSHGWIEVQGHKADATFPMEEQVAHYHHLADVLVAMQRAAGALRSDQPALPGDLALLAQHLVDDVGASGGARLDGLLAAIPISSGPGWQRRRQPSPSLGDQRRLVAEVVNWLLAVGRIEPRYVWPASADVPRLEWSPDHGDEYATTSGLWSALTLQLIDQLRDPDDFGVCSVCSDPLTRANRRIAPKAGQYAYCKRPECVRQQVRRSQQKARERQRNRPARWRAGGV